MEKKASRSKFLIPFYIAFAVTVCAAAGGMLFLTAGDERPVHRFILPKGFTGWVEVVYEQPGYPALKKEGRSFVYEVPSSGKIATSSRNASGPMELYYAEQDGRRIELPTDVPMVHGLGASSGGSGGPNRPTEKLPGKLSFFVGTEEQWREAAERNPPHD